MFALCWKKSFMPSLKIYHSAADSVGIHSWIRRSKTFILSWEKDWMPSLKKTMILQEALQSFTVEVTLDPDTAHHNLRVSNNQKTLTHEDMCNLKDYPQRFSCSPCVLGWEGFVSGLYYWEVKVRSQGNGLWGGHSICQEG
ncbi:Vespryn [Varanus komodoensis]|nr:Vespryn [Varanus komodoensis]